MNFALAVLPRRSICDSSCKATVSRCATVAAVAGSNDYVATADVWTQSTHVGSGRRVDQGSSSERLVCATMAAGSWTADVAQSADPGSGHY